MYLFCPKVIKNDSRKSFIKNPLDNMLYALSFSVSFIGAIHLCRPPKK